MVAAKFERQDQAGVVNAVEVSTLLSIRAAAFVAAQLLYVFERRCATRVRFSARAVAIFISCAGLIPNSMREVNSSVALWMLSLSGAAKPGSVGGFAFKSPFPRLRR